MSSLIDTHEIKKLVERIEDGDPAKIMIMSLPDQISKQELALKFDLIWPFLISKKGGSNK